MTNVQQHPLKAIGDRLFNADALNNENLLHQNIKTYVLDETLSKDSMGKALRLLIDNGDVGLKLMVPHRISVKALVIANFYGLELIGIECTGSSEDWCVAGEKTLVCNDLFIRGKPLLHSTLICHLSQGE